MRRSTVESPRDLLPKEVRTVGIMGGGRQAFGQDGQFGTAELSSGFKPVDEFDHLGPLSRGQGGDLVEYLPDSHGWQATTGRKPVKLHFGSHTLLKRRISPNLSLNVSRTRKFMWPPVYDWELGWLWA